MVTLVPGLVCHLRLRATFWNVTALGQRLWLLLLFSSLMVAVPMWTGERCYFYSSGHSFDKHVLSPYHVVGTVVSPGGTKNRVRAFLSPM